MSFSSCISTEPIGYTILPNSSYNKILLDSSGKNSPQAVGTPEIADCAAKIAGDLFANLFQKQGSQNEQFEFLKTCQSTGSPNPFLQVKIDENTFKNVDLRSLAVLNVQKQPKNPDHWETLVDAIRDDEFVYLPIEDQPKTMYSKLECRMMAQKLRVEVVESFEIQSRIMITTWDRAVQGEASISEWLSLSRTLLNSDVRNQKTRAYANRLSVRPKKFLTALDCASQAMALNPQEQASMQQILNCLSVGEQILQMAVNPS